MTPDHDDHGRIAVARKSADRLVGIDLAVTDDSVEPATRIVSGDAVTWFEDGCVRREHWTTPDGDPDVTWSCPT